jgi:hypothetical protein
MRNIVDECKHVRGLQPHWIDNTRRELAKQYIIDEDTRNRELRGINTKGSPYCFEGDKVRHIFAKPRMNAMGYIRDIYIIVDTNTGNEDQHATITSKFALISLTTFFDGGYLILGAENIVSNVPQDYLPQVKDHIARLKRTFPNANCWMATEGVMGQDASWVKDAMTAYGYHDLIFYSNKKQKDGFKTTWQSKFDMMLLTQKLIFEDKIHIYNGFITSAPDIAVLFEEFQKQMCVFSQQKSKPKNPADVVRVKLTGKIEKGACDDLAIVLQSAIYYIPFMMNDPKYSMHRYK